VDRLSGAIAPQIFGERRAGDRAGRRFAELSLNQNSTLLPMSVSGSGAAE
jgi:hypothetical protein